MRIGVIYLGWRGSGGPLSYEFATHLQHSAEVFVLLAEGSNLLTACHKAGLPVLTTPTYRSFGQAVFSWLNQGNLRHLAGKVRLQQPDVLFFPMFYTWNPFLQHYLSDIPSLVAVHDPAPHPGLEGLAYRWLEDASIRQARRVLILSHALLPQIERRGVPANRVSAIAHGMLGYYSRFASIPASPKVGVTTLLFFGRISPYKGLDILLDAYRDLSKDANLRLCIVGAGNLRPYLQQLQSLPRVEVVNRWIRDEEVGHFFRQADIVVLPYTSASQSGVVAIAAAFGMPVVATKVGGLPEQIEDKVSGLLVNPGSSNELADALEFLIHAPTEAARLGQQLKNRFEQQFSWETIAAGVYQACQQAVQAQDE